MISFFRTARQRVTEFWEEGFRWPDRDERSLALTGHFEEVFVGNDIAGDPVFDIREVPRFTFTRHPEGVPHRIVCRTNRRNGPVRELVW